MGSLLNQTVFITQQVEVVVAFLGELVELSLVSQSLLIFLTNAVRKGILMRKSILGGCVQCS